MRRTVVTIVALAAAMLIVLVVTTQDRDTGETADQSDTSQQQSPPEESKEPEEDDASSEDDAVASADEDASDESDETEAQTAPDTQTAEVDGSATQPGAASTQQADAAQQADDDADDPDQPAADALSPADLQLVEPAPDRSKPVTIGSNEADSGFLMQVRLSQWGAAVYSVTLTEHRETVQRDSPPYQLMHRLAGGGDEVDPYAARSLRVTNPATGDSRFIDNLDTDASNWALVPGETNEQQATYRLTLANEAGESVLAVERTYQLKPGSYELNLKQRVVNYTDTDLEVQWSQFIQGDLPYDASAYLGDRRMFATGYFPGWDEQRATISADNGLIARNDLVAQSNPQVWPNDYLENPDAHDLAWLASENRFFTVVTHAAVADAVTETSEVTPLEAIYPNVGVVELAPSGGGNDPEQTSVILTLTSGTVDVPANGENEEDLSLGIYAGPRKTEIMREPPMSALNLESLVRYELGCTWCTFQFLADFLLWFLKFIHSFLFDWGIAIIVLVLVVRLLLHPITKRAQINMMKMSKQMQALQPEINKLKKKYADNQQKLNQEMMQLYREKGVSPIGMLGCLPMFLQMPIWIALYAMLYFAIELRHEWAFYGVFQRIGDLFGFNWYFLQDLSTADNFIRFFPPGVEGYALTWIPFVNLHFSGINILPILMAVVFFIQQKLTTPPAASEQAAQQQKIMRVIVLIFPVILYAAPSGLTLYILASTCAGIIDSYIVRKHVREQEEAGTLFQKKERKPGGFMDRMAKRMEQKQKELQQKMEQQQQQKGGRAGGKGRKKKSR